MKQEKKPKMILITCYERKDKSLSYVVDGWETLDILKDYLILSKLNDSDKKELNLLKRLLDEKKVQII